MLSPKVEAAFLIRLLINVEKFKMLQPFVTEIDKLFNKAKQNAKLTGKMVGIALALGYPFKLQTISLIGFSLGTQVIKSCLRTLDKIGVHDII